MIETALQTGIQGIEWGGDIHVPPGNWDNAEKVAQLTRNAGIEVISYGSYYRLGVEEQDVSFEGVLQTAVKLTVPAIRVWAGNIGSAKAIDSHWDKVVDDARRIADLAATHGIHINLEYHNRTLTDTPDSAVQLMKAIDHANVSLYWQPSLYETVAEKVDSINKIRKWLSHVHVFHWEFNKDKVIVHPFSEGISDWKQYLKQLEDKYGIRYLMMEFVKGDSISQLQEDVQALRALNGS
ncbi:sugar phosphate isomerase/epimerase family protein [Gracilibacillus phocaeensis]|uniref:sugar phosphate isomerase/epimerase family protein n=1 Tax=Gracilibacillus phocaeensis TaxID=2042304 RepID=UPI002570DE64|nr:TIM barrel protein [Gracilibacillus phocaeensis]